VLTVPLPKAPVFRPATQHGPGASEKVM
jgi:hypothetical protein